ncbi:hypothetical protein F3Y22_tig00117011pilonHSYRG00096 [Hibiscus syriacus]|uniref:DUF668 domain-containing protein n=1 Tax=Hibiscus syriacus TaxID=106335 RepID=A0A6A2WCV4_HIBSY|nr:hypothetical protein F3Y22_tig00117011pilonHSYRG00096 [Hibiscus syriacus]
MNKLLSIVAADKSTTYQTRWTIRQTMKEQTSLAQHTSIVEKFVDIVTYMHQLISEAFRVRKETTENPRELGVAGLSLEYANLINQIDNIAARLASLPPNVRDTLYHGLPPAVKEVFDFRGQG